MARLALHIGDGGGWIGVCASRDGDGEMIERRIRMGKVYEVQVGESVGPIRGAVIKREVAPNADELEQMECARRVDAYIKQLEAKG